MRYRTAALLLLLPLVAGAQQGVTSRRTNLRRDASTSRSPIELIGAQDTVTLLSATKRNGFYHVTASDGNKGWAWARNIRLLSVNPTLAAPTSAPPSTSNFELAGSNSFAGCGDGLWQHVYHPARLLIHQKCVTVTGTIVDPTAHNAHPTADHVRHEADGDTHGWLKLDPPFQPMLNAGNTSDEDGNLVFELVCHYSVTQADAKSSCQGFKYHTAIPAVGTHVEVKGTFVQDDNHAHWNEIHPVSSLRVIP
jgi:hypothetical protein